MCFLFQLVSCKKETSDLIFCNNSRSPNNFLNKLQTFLSGCFYSFWVQTGEGDLSWMLSWSHTLTPWSFVEVCKKETSGFISRMWKHEKANGWRSCVKLLPLLRCIYFFFSRSSRKKIYRYLAVFRLGLCAFGITKSQERFTNFFIDISNRLYTWNIFFVTPSYLVFYWLSLKWIYVCILLQFKNLTMTINFWFKILSYLKKVKRVKQYFRSH